MVWTGIGKSEVLRWGFFLRVGFIVTNLETRSKKPGPWTWEAAG